MSIWAVTSYFNPSGFASRYRNFVAFRRALKLPLLTLEWSQRGAFQLGRDDSDELIQLSGGGLMWQKERLLNLAIAALPASCENVVWLDCDVVFEDAAWDADLAATMSEFSVVQLFSEVVHLDPGAQSTFLVRPSLAAASLSMSAAELGRRIRSGAFDQDGSATAEAHERVRLGSRPSSGHAWAAPRALLAEHGLYDGCICGSGDMAFALAAIGRSDLFVESFPLNPKQQHHYQSWAAPLAAATGGKVGSLPTRVRHLYHGPLNNRRYHSRLQWAADSGFDPAVDLAIDEHGLWQWRGDAAVREIWMERYFAQRSEDEA